MMKGKWKILVMMAIVGMFAMPMIPVKGATILSRGDIVFGKTLYPIPQIPEWQHACLYRGSYSQNIVQSDPHFEKWSPIEKWWWASGQWDKLQNSLNSKGVGGVEYTTLSEIHGDYWRVAYGRVINVPDLIKSYATTFAEGKVGRHFDIVSYWKYKTKQIEGPADHYSGWYYCAELVWASYAKYNIYLDPHDEPDDHRVYPEEIYHNSYYVNIIYDEGIGW